MKKVIYICYFYILLLLSCDWGCKKDHLFEFSYPNQNNSNEFIFDVDYSDVPPNEECVKIRYNISAINCSNKNTLVIEVYGKFSSEDTYYLDETLEILPQETQEFSRVNIANDCMKDRFVSFLIKGLNSDCFNGKINIKPDFLVGGLGKAKCPYGYEVD